MTDSDPSDYNDPLKVLLWSAYVEGFKRSGEGWNGEYPWYQGDQQQESMRNDLREGFGKNGGFEGWYDGIDVDVVPIGALQELVEMWRADITISGFDREVAAKNQTLADCADELQELVSEYE